MPVIDNAENSAKCLCPGCPSYNSCMREKTEALYCGRDKTECKLEKRGCLCGSCPVHKENNLDGYYYCVSGAAT